MSNHLFSSPIASARTFLFVPANRPDRYAKALATAADAVVLDLEDAVPEADKQSAREAISREWPTLSAHEKPVVVRINSPLSEAGSADLQWLARLQPCPALMVAKAETSSALQLVSAAQPQALLMPLIESAQGYINLAEIAAVPNVARLVVGHIDFLADTGIQCSADQHEIHGLRFAVCIQSRVHNLATPVDGVTVDIDNDELLRTDTLRSLRFGFGGKLCIHPRQINAVHAAMAPTASEVEWARRVLEGDRAAGGAAFKLDGRMVDMPVVLQAKRTLERSGR